VVVRFFRLLALLWLVLGSVLSAAPAGRAATEDGGRDCAKLASDWRELIPLTDEGFAVLSGCRKDNSGSWRLPAGPDDLHFPNSPILSQEEKRSSMAIRQMIGHDLGAFVPLLPQWMNDKIESFYSPVKRPGYGHFDPGAVTAGFQNQYAEALVNYLQDPNRIWTARYTAWWWDRRQAAIPPTWCAATSQIVCASIRNIVGASAVPWPWDLQDDLTLAEFVKWAIVSGYIR
jgi:hypothetical protein